MKNPLKKHLNLMLKSKRDIYLERDDDGYVYIVNNISMLVMTAGIYDVMARPLSPMFCELSSKEAARWLPSENTPLPEKTPYEGRWCKAWEDYKCKAKFSVTPLKIKALWPHSGGMKKKDLSHDLFEINRKLAALDSDYAAAAAEYMEGESFLAVSETGAFVWDGTDFNGVGCVICPCRVKLPYETEKALRRIYREDAEE